MMHVSWTTLQEQIFAKLRRPYRSEANMNEVGHDRSNLNIAGHIPDGQLLHSGPHAWWSTSP
jgi:hypothetical protein